MTLLWAVTLCLLALTVNGEEHTCNKYVKNNVCGNTGSSLSIDSCNSHYSDVNKVKSNIQKFTATHIDQNWHYLLMSANFGNFKANREGFSKLFRKLADDAWEDTMDLIKYMAKRGFNMDYSVAPNKVNIGSYVMNELESISTALDMQKTLAEEAHELHRQITGHKEFHDAETINFIEKEFVGKHAETIRDLAGHANDLHSLINGKLPPQNSLVASSRNDQYDPSLSIYMFDEYLKKIIS